VPAPQGGNDAVGAAPAAALGDLEVGEGKGARKPRPGVDSLRRPLRGREQAGGPGGTFHCGKDPVKGPGSEKGIHLGKRLTDSLPVPLREAAGHHQPAAPAGFPVRGELEDPVDGLLGRGLDEAAGIHHDGVGLFRRLREGPAPGCHPGGHGLAVHQVAGAAEADEANLPGRAAPGRPAPAGDPRGRFPGGGLHPSAFGKRLTP